MNDAANRIERLRRFRARPERELSIGPLVQSAATEAGRSHKKLGQFIDLWEELIPPELARRTTITAMRGGTAHVSVDSAATAFELDRLLRDGVFSELRSRYRGTLARVKVKQGS